MINNISSSFNSVQLPESSVKRPEGFQGSSSDCFVRDQDKDYQTQKQMQDALRNASFKFQSGQASATKQGNEIEGDGVSMYPNREGYKTDFLGRELPLPQLGDNIKDKASHLIDQPDEIELKYTNFSVVMNAERKQCFYTICNIDGNQLSNIKRSGSWTIDGRIPREHQLGNEAYSRNDIDKGHMVRRLDACWGKNARQANNDTFCYTNATMQHGNLNKVEWLNLEDHVLSSAKGQKLTVITGPVFADDDPKFNNHGSIKDGDVQIPQQFWKVVVWNDEKSGELKGAAFVMSQKDILEADQDLFKGKTSGIDPTPFATYQVPISKLEDMTSLKFGEVNDITANACRLSPVDNFRPQGL